MSVRDITPETVYTAISEGHDDVDKLAVLFGVMHVSHTLRSTMAELGDRGWIEKIPDTHRFRLARTEQ